MKIKRFCECGGEMKEIGICGDIEKYPGAGTTIRCVLYQCQKCKNVEIAQEAKNLIKM